MATDDHKDLIHAVNNLLAVIHTQAAAAGAACSLAAAEAALRFIEQAAEHTARHVEDFRRRALRQREQG